MGKKTRSKVSSPPHYANFDNKRWDKTARKSDYPENQSKRHDEQMRRIFESGFESVGFEQSTSTLSYPTGEIKKKSWKKTLASLFKRKHHEKRNSRDSDTFYNRRCNTRESGTKSRKFYEPRADYCEEESSVYERGDDYSDHEESAGDFSESLESTVKSARKHISGKRYHSHHEKEPMLHNSPKCKRSPVPFKSVPKQSRKSPCSKLQTKQASSTDTEEYSESEVYDSEEYSTEEAASGIYSGSCLISQSPKPIKVSSPPSAKRFCSQTSPKTGYGSDEQRVIGRKQKSSETARRESPSRASKNEASNSQKDLSKKTTTSANDNQKVRLCLFTGYGLLHAEKMLMQYNFFTKPVNLG